MPCRWASDEWKFKATERKQSVGNNEISLTTQTGVERTCWCNFQVILDYHEKVLSKGRGYWGLWEGKRRGNPSYRPASLTLIPGKVMEQILLKAIYKHMKDRKVIRSRQHWFTKKSFLTCLISCDELTCQWTREEQQRFILTLVQFSTLSLITTLLTNWWRIA